MDITKEKIIGWLGACVFCLLLFLLLLFTVMVTKVQTGEEGVLVNFGTVSLASGTFTPRTTGIPAENPSPERIVQQPEPTPVKPKIQQPAVKPRQAQPVIKGNEQTVAVDDAAKRRRQEEKERERVEAERVRAEQAKAEEERRKREAINQQVSGAFGAGTSAQSQSGQAASGAGIQGNPESSSTAGSPTGSGGYGEFNLSGRSLNGGLPRPSYTVQEEGRIVINITVDIKGNVILAETGKGTTIINPKLRQAALEAAKRAKFNSLASGNNQSGTITYTYRFSK
jgi:TonB family protein